MEGLELLKGFEERFRFTFIWIRGDETDMRYCTTWTLCIFDFIMTLAKDDTVKINLELLDSADQPIPNNGPKIQEKGEDCVVHEPLPGQLSCFCPGSKEFDVKVCHAVAPLSCQNLNQNDQLVGGLKRKQPAFKIKIDNDDRLTENKHVYAKMGDTYYTFSYKQNGEENTDYKIQIGPTKAVGALLKASSNYIEMNFDLANNLVIFNDVECIVNAEKTEWLCECCAHGSCKRADVESQIQIQYATVIQNYGHLFLEFKLKLDAHEQFNFEGTGLQKGFDENLRLQFVLTRGDDETETQYCTTWPTCAFNFTKKLSTGDQVTINLELVDQTNALVPDSLVSVDEFKIEDSPKIQAKGTGCVRNEQHKGQVSCTCPDGKAFDDVCHGIAPYTCQQLQQNDNQIDGETKNHPAFKLQIAIVSQPQRSVYAKMDQNCYSFSYEPSGNGYNVKIGSVKTSPDFVRAVSNSIQTNFGVNGGVALFSNVQCTVNDDKTKWTCECCAPGTCSAKLPDPAPLPPNNPDPTIPIHVTAPTPQAPRFRVGTEAPFDPSKDPCENPSGETEKLCEILESDQINGTNFDTVVNETKSAIYLQDSSVGDVVVLSKILEKIANFKNATVEQRKNALSLLDQALTIDDNKFVEAKRVTSDRYLDALHKLLSYADKDLTFLDGKNLGAQKTTLTCLDDNNKWSGIANNAKSFWVSGGEPNSGSTASIELSHERLCQGQHKGSESSAYFVIYRNSKLFHESENKDGSDSGNLKQRSFVQRFAEADHNEKPSGDKKNRCKKDFDPTNGLILTSVVWNGSATNQIDAQLKFKKEKFNLAAHSNLAVTWWDKTEWSESGQCKFELVGDEYVAHCDHLTNFALLVEKSSTDPLLCDTVLDRLGFWLSVISLVALAFLVLIYSTRLIPLVRDSAFIRIVNNHRRAGSDTYIILYVFVTLVFYFMFLVFADQSVTGSAAMCKFTAAFLYYLFLSAMLLNVFQAWDMIKTCAWSSRVESRLQMMTRIWIVVPISLGLPLFICLILWFVDAGFFFRDDQFCWIRPHDVVLAIFIPVTLMLLNSFVTFGIFCVRMFPDFFQRFGIQRASVQLAKAERNNRKLNVELFIALIFAQIILGFPWIMQYPAMFSSGATAWHYLFALFNGTNGFILFLMFLYGRAVDFYRIRKARNIGTKFRTTNLTETASIERTETEQSGNESN